MVDSTDEVTSPDQHRPTISRRLARTGAVLTIVALVAMARWGNHDGNVENIFLYGIAGLLAFMLVADVVLRRKGLKDS